MKPKNEQNTLEISKLPKYPINIKNNQKYPRNLENDQNTPETYKLTKIPLKPKK